MINALGYQEILIKNRDLGEQLKRNPEYRIDVLSNIMAPQIKEILEYSLRSDGINAVVEFGNYDNVVQDSLSCSRAKAVIIFWEAANLISGLQFKSDLMAEEELRALIGKVKGEIDYVLSRLAGTPLVIFNKFSALLFNQALLQRNNLDRIVTELNTFLEQRASSHIVLVDIDKVIAGISVQKSVDWRFYYSSKALYTVDFYKRYSEYIRPLFMSANGKAKKVLIFDCDNTLWKGILGEDGIAGIQMNDETREGALFGEIQGLALSLTKKGIILGICSKNNPADVDEVLYRHPDMKIRNNDLTVKRVNWLDKLLNLNSIVKELNVGADSIVFVDDSDFEVRLIQDKMPAVKAIQVPKILHNYPALFRGNMGLFFNLSVSAEDMKRADMYKQNKARHEIKDTFASLEDYLRALEIKVTVYEDNRDFISRIAQLTQKTNQFNFSTKRYTEADITATMDNDNCTVFSFAVADKFGDSGLVGVLIIKYQNDNAEIDTFLMSCRVLGRNIEYAVFDLLMERLKQRGVSKLSLAYVKTLKNAQIQDFLSGFDLDLMSEVENEFKYLLAVPTYKSKNKDYIGVQTWKKN